MSIAAGVAAGSIALVVCLDSFIEVSAAAIVAWELRGISEDRERAAVRLIALTSYASPTTSL